MNMIQTEENISTLYTYINEDEIDSELKCTICNEPFQSPFNCTECGQTFCQECISLWRQQQNSCPSCRKIESTFTPVISRVVINQLNRLLIQCSLCQQTNIQRHNFSDHISHVCPKQMIICPKNCKWKGPREELEQHLIKCQGKCSKWFRFTQRVRWFACLS
jgi:hypothetical protein